MPTGGTTKFTDADDYHAGVRGAKFHFVFSCQRDFEARLTWVELRHLCLLRGQENLPRVAHVSLTPDSVFVEFPTRHNAPLIYNGVELQLGEIVFHGRGEHLHQRTRGPSQWCFISSTPEQLAAIGETLTGFNLMSPGVA